MTDEQGDTEERALEANAQLELPRRDFLAGAAGAAGAAVVATTLIGAPFQAAAHHRYRLPFSPDYGPLYQPADARTKLALLLLPRGFYYTSGGWAGDLLRDGAPTPDRHDEMAVVWEDRRYCVLVRNHERRRLRRRVLAERAGLR